MISQGDKYIKKKTVFGKIKTATVESKEPEDEYIIQMKDSEGKKFFVHIEVLKTKWHDVKKGVQFKMFR